MSFLLILRPWSLNFSPLHSFSKGYQRVFCFRRCCFLSSRWNIFPTSMNKNAKHHHAVSPAGYYIIIIIYIWSRVSSHFSSLKKSRLNLHKPCILSVSLRPFLLFHIRRVHSHKNTIEIRSKQFNVPAQIGFCDVSVTSACNPIMPSESKSPSFPPPHSTRWNL